MPWGRAGCWYLSTYVYRHKHLEVNFLAWTFSKITIAGSPLVPVSFMALDQISRTRHECPPVEWGSKLIRKHLVNFIIILSVLQQWAHFAWQLGSWHAPTSNGCIDAFHYPAACTAASDTETQEQGWCFLLEIDFSTSCNQTHVWARVSLHPELTGLANLTDQHGPGIHVTLPHKCWDFKCMSPRPAVDMSSEDQLRSLCLWGKDFYN